MFWEFTLSAFGNPRRDTFNLPHSAGSLMRDIRFTIGHYLVRDFRGNRYGVCVATIHVFLASQEDLQHGCMPGTESRLFSMHASETERRI
jgi:hypothetical protein